MQSPFLVGDAIYLRPLEIEDARTIVPWFNDAEVTRFLLRCHPMNVAKEEEWIRHIYDSSTDLALGITLRADDRLIGTTGLHQIDLRNRNAAFGIIIGDKSCWSKGYGTETTRLIVRHAFRTLNLHRLWLEVYEHNPRGIRAYEKAGFRIEGRLRQDIFRDGRYWDTFLMGVLRDEWQAANGERAPTHSGVDTPGY